MSLFQSPQLLDRPPTPPKDRLKDTTDDHIRGALSFLDVSYSSTKPQQLDTPPQSSPLHPNHPPDSLYSCKDFKHIRFVPHPSFCDDPDTFGKSPTERQPPLRDLLPSRQQQSSKSILKSSDHSSTADPDSQTSPPPLHLNSAQMLESVCRQLAGGSSAAKVDGYNVLSNYLRAHQDVPSSQALSSKLPLIEDFLRRDIPIGRRSENLIDVKLSVQALKVAGAFFGDDPLFASKVQPEFLDWLMEDTISLLSSSVRSKEVLKHQVYLLSLPDFCKAALTGDRVSKILQSLATIHQRVTGIAIVSLRLLVQERLFVHAKACMVRNPSLWIPPIVHDLLSSSDEIFARALSTGMTGAQACGSSESISRFTRHFLDQASHGTGTNLDGIESALTDLIQNPSRRQRVPKILNILILLLRGDSKRLERWSSLHQWCESVLRCFNSKDYNLNIRAYATWNCFMRAISPGPSTPEPILKALRKPINAQFRRSQTSKGALKTSDAAMSSACLFLYYGLRPGVTFEQYGIFWREFVQGILGNMKVDSFLQAQSARQILMSMFSRSTTKVWSVQQLRSNPAGPTKPTEIPRVDAQWICTNIEIVIDTMTPWLCARKENCSTDYSAKENPVVALWSSLLDALAETSSKEIKPSNKTRSAVSALVQCIVRLINSPPVHSTNDLKDEAAHLQDCWSLTMSMLDILGPSSLTEMCVQEAKSSSNSNALNAPPGRHWEGRKPQASIPLILVLLGVFLRKISSDPSLDFHADFSAALKPCLETKASRHATLLFLRDCASLLSSFEMSPLSGCQTDTTWLFIMDTTISLLQSEWADNGGVIHHENHLEHETILSILKLMLKSSCAGHEDEMTTLFESAHMHMKRIAGEGGMMLGLMRPLSLISAQGDSAIPLETRVRCFTFVLQGIQQPPSSKALRAGHKALHGHPPASEPGTDWFDVVCRSLNSILICSGSDDSLVTESCIEALFAAIGDFAMRPSCLFADQFLLAIQGGLAHWARQELYRSQPRADEAKISDLWNSMMHCHQRMGPHDGNSLSSLSLFWCSGFCSPSRKIAFATIVEWNRTFGLQESLQYPDNVKRVLKYLRQIASISLPSLEQDEDDSADQTELSEMFPWYARDGSQGQASSLQEEVPRAAFIKKNDEKLSLKTNHRAALSSKAHARTPEPRTPRHKLRHDDSQIQFVSVESSPLRRDNDSQFLTENQKDVRHRQKADAALFSEFNSTPPDSKNSHDVETPATNAERSKTIASHEHHHEATTLGAQTAQSAAHSLRDKRTKNTEPAKHVEPEIGAAHNSYALAPPSTHPPARYDAVVMPTGAVDHEEEASEQLRTEQAATTQLPNKESSHQTYDIGASEVVLADSAAESAFETCVTAPEGLDQERNDLTSLDENKENQKPTSDEGQVLSHASPGKLALGNAFDGQKEKPLSSVPLEHGDFLQPETGPQKDQEVAYEVPGIEQAPSSPGSARMQALPSADEKAPQATNRASGEDTSKYSSSDHHDAINRIKDSFATVQSPIDPGESPDLCITTAEGDTQPQRSRSSSPDLIRALSSSPDRSQLPVIHITACGHTTELTPSNRKGVSSSSACSDQSPSASKRKRSTPTTSSRKRSKRGTSLASSTRSLHDTPTPNPPEEGTEMGELIILEPTTPFTPTFDQAVRSRLSSQPQSQRSSPSSSSQGRRRGRQPKRGSSSSSLLKRSFESMSRNSGSQDIWEVATTPEPTPKRARVNPRRSGGPGWSGPASASASASTSDRGRAKSKRRIPPHGSHDAAVQSPPPRIPPGLRRRKAEARDRVLSSFDHEPSSPHPAASASRQSDVAHGRVDEQSQASLSQASLARSVMTRLQGILSDCKKLVLGGRERDQQRRELVGLGEGVRDAIGEAGSRGGL